MAGLLIVTLVLLALVPLAYLYGIKVGLRAGKAIGKETAARELAAWLVV